MDFDSVASGPRKATLRSLEWPDLYLQPASGAKFGFIDVRKGNSKNAKRNVSLNPQVRTMLKARSAGRKSAFVFTDDSGIKPVPIWTLEDQHRRMREALKLPADAVIHSFRHTFGTRLGEAGADASSIMRIMGHSTVVVSQKYVRPTPGAMERAFERLNAANEKALVNLPKGTQSQQTEYLPTTISTAATNAQAEDVDQAL